MAVRSDGALAQGEAGGVRRRLAFPLIVGLLGIALVAGGFIWMAVDKAATSVAAAPQMGKQLANFTLSDLSGKPVSLSQYAGRPVLINAWATWCPPCQAEMPDLDNLYKKYKDSGFVILGIDAGEDPRIVNSYITERGFSFPILLDPQTALLEKYAIRDYPTSIVIGRDGKVKLIQVGILTPDAIQKVVEPLISG